MIIEEQKIDVDGLLTNYLTAGEGPPLVLLHALGQSSLDWRWVIPELGRTHRVFAPDLPGFGDSAKPAADYSPAFFTRFVVAYLDTLGIERAMVAGSSLGGLVALRLALSQSAYVSSLSLIGSVGLGRAVSYILRSATLPGYGELAIALSRTPVGAAQRAWLRARLLFAYPRLAPSEWLREQHRLAQLPGYLEAELAALRAQTYLGGQREVLLNQIPTLEMPTLVIWGTSDRVLPTSQAREAAARLQRGSLELIPNCGHLPHVEQPDRFVAAFDRFFGEQINH